MTVGVSASVGIRVAVAAGRLVEVGGALVTVTGPGVGLGEAVNRGYPQTANAARVRTMKTPGIARREMVGRMGAAAATGVGVSESVLRRPADGGGVTRSASGVNTPGIVVMKAFANSVPEA